MSENPKAERSPLDGPEWAAAQATVPAPLSEDPEHKRRMAKLVGADADSTGEVTESGEHPMLPALAEERRGLQDRADAGDEDAKRRLAEVDESIAFYQGGRSKESAAARRRAAAEAKAKEKSDADTKSDADAKAKADADAARAQAPQGRTAPAKATAAAAGDGK